MKLPTNYIYQRMSDFKFRYVPNEEGEPEWVCERASATVHKLYSTPPGILVVAGDDCRAIRVDYSDEPRTPLSRYLAWVDDGCLYEASSVQTPTTHFAFAISPDMSLLLPFDRHEQWDWEGLRKKVLDYMSDQPRGTFEYYGPDRAPVRQVKDSSYWILFGLRRGMYLQSIACLDKPYFTKDPRDALRFPTRAEAGDVAVKYPNFKIHKVTLSVD